MNYKNLIISISILPLLCACNRPTNNNAASKKQVLIELDNISGLKEKKQFYLSDFVDSIEYVKLETNPNCLISNAWPVVGNKYIVIVSINPARILLFNRNGKYVQQIGKMGKGPGEFGSFISIDLSPDESKILILDNSSHNIIEYSTEGQFIQEFKSTKSIAVGPYYLNNNTIAFMQGYPFVDSTNFPRVIATSLDTQTSTPLYFIDFKSVNIQNVAYYFNQFSKNDQGIIFKDCMSDTLYQLYSDLKVSPKVSVDVGENKPPAYALPMDEFHYDVVGVINDLPKHLIIQGTYKDRFHQIYEKQSGTLFTLPKLKGCKGENDYGYGIINDLDGLAPIWYSSLHNTRGGSINSLKHFIHLKEWSNEDCFKEANLKTNQYRDKLLKIVEESSIYDNPILRVMHLK